MGDFGALIPLSMAILSDVPSVWAARGTKGERRNTWLVPNWKELSSERILGCLIKPNITLELCSNA